MRRINWGVRAGLLLALTTVLAGCGHHGNPSPPPQEVMPADQMQKGIADINNNPQLSPQQKANMIQMIRDHVKVTAPAK